NGRHGARARFDGHGLALDAPAETLGGLAIRDRLRLAEEDLFDDRGLTLRAVLLFEALRGARDGGDAIGAVALVGAGAERRERDALHVARRGETDGIERGLLEHLERRRGLTARAGLGRTRGGPDEEVAVETAARDAQDFADFEELLLRAPTLEIERALKVVAPRIRELGVGRGPGPELKVGSSVGNDGADTLPGRELEDRRTTKREVHGARSLAHARKASTTTRTISSRGETLPG